MLALLASVDSAIVLQLTLIVALGTAAQWVASLMRVPSLLFLLALGIVLGATGVLDPDAVFGEHLSGLVSMAVAVLLFEGGLSLRWQEARLAGRAVWGVMIAGLVFGSVATALLAKTVAGLSLGTAAVLGGILVVTGPTVIGPMLRNARIASRPATLLKWEGIINDPLGALLAVLVFQVVVASAAGGGVGTAVLQFAIGAVVAAFVGWLAARLLGLALSKHWIPHHLTSPVILAGVLLVFLAGQNLAEESGLLGVTVMGLVLANLEGTEVAEIRRFKEQIVTLLVAALFLVLSARLDSDRLLELGAGAIAFVAAVIFIVRPLVVIAGTWGTDITWRERALVGWVAPRGVVAAAVAGAFEPRLAAVGYRDAELLVPIIFAVILTTVVAHGLTIRPLGRLLGLGVADGNGMLIVGVRNWTISLAKALASKGVFVLMTDTSYPRVSQARREGLNAHYGDVLEEDELLLLPVERVSWAFAATDDDVYNRDVCSVLTHEVAAARLLRVASPAGSPATGKGRAPWEQGTYASLARAYWRSEQGVKVTQITDEFSWDDLRGQYPEGEFLFQIVDGKLGIVDDPRSGATIVFIPGRGDGATAAASA